LIIITAYKCIINNYKTKALELTVHDIVHGIYKFTYIDYNYQSLSLRVFLIENLQTERLCNMNFSRTFCGKFLGQRKNVQI